MVDVVLWSGPVGQFQVPGATVRGAKTYFFECVGDVQPGKAHCPSIPDAWIDGSGRRLPGLLRSVGLSESDVDHVYLGAFSAGGSAWKKLLAHPNDRARVTAVMLADASYSANGTASNPAFIEEFVLYGLDAMRDPKKLFVATASSNQNKAYGSGAQVLAATQREIERRSGAAFEAGGSLPISVQPLGLWTSPSKNVIFADYGATSDSQHNPHEYQPFIAPQLWKNVLQPWIDSGGFGVTVPWFKLGVVVAGAVGGYVLTEQLTS